MANYNNAEYIGEAIKSVLNQTYKNWELIIIDDCSIDKSQEIIQNFSDDKRIRFSKNTKNVGYIATLIKMIKQTDSKIFGILDSDDSLVRDAVEIMIKAHNNHRDCGLIYSQFMQCDQNMKPKAVGYCRPVPDGESNIFNSYTSHFKTFKKSDYFKSGCYDKKIKYAEDKDIILKMEEVTKLFFVDKILYNFRILPNSQGHHFIKKRIGKKNFLLAKYNAYKRRKKSNIPNISKMGLMYDIIKNIKNI